MKLADRILKIQPSPTLEVAALANALKAKGIDVISFGAGEPDFDTPQNIKDAAIRAIETGKTKYTPAGGINELKKAVADKFLRDNNLEYKISEIIINSGGKHSIYNLMQVLLNEGDEVIIPSPYWVSYPPIVELAGGVPVIIDTTDETNFKILPGQLKKAVTKKTRAVVINSPSNPTGAAYTEKELRELVSVVEGTDILIISDDIYESIVFDNFKFINCASFSPEIKKQTVVLNGVSKTYSMTGWRIGYMACDEEIIKKVDILQSQSTSNPTSIAQWASVEALNGDQGIIVEMLTAFERRRKIIVDGLNSVPGFSCFNPNGAFYAFPKISGLFKMNGWNKISEKYSSKYNSSKLTSYLLEEARVAVVPGIAFGNDDFIRLSFATSDENILKGLKRINEAINKLT
jgi:aspartate aminotransferase